VKFKVDENLPIELAKMLRQAGHDAMTVLEQQYGGSADIRLATLCQQENRILVTLDMDFADIRTFRPADYPGLMVLRLSRHDKPHVLSVFSRVMQLLPTESLDNTLWIIEENRIRIRT
jgi:predicted nuclease of predicted toxin-antitoxin system